MDGDSDPVTIRYSPPQTNELTDVARVTGKVCNFEKTGAFLPTEAVKITVLCSFSPAKARKDLSAVSKYVTCRAAYTSERVCTTDIVTSVLEEGFAPGETANIWDPDDTLLHTGSENIEKTR